ncbi:hypothetical protein [Primorskyibacter sp. S187A]|uniref:hypothetical protein n=1 Tax=Primorskyibacter sp. S187A TaxID=3415130 RepID=UPI003C7B47E1
MTPMHIRESEAGRVRIFAIDLPMTEAQRLTQTPGALAAMLGLSEIDTGQLEIFDTSDLAGMGLETYLLEGHAIPQDELTPMRWQLDALEGPVMILRSAAILQRPVDMRPAAPLRWIATFGEAQATTPVVPLKAETARGSLGGAPAPRRQKSSLWSLLVAAMLVAALGGTLWFVFGGAQ